jgi:hypothetical protein
MKIKNIKATYGLVRKNNEWVEANSEEIDKQISEQKIVQERANSLNKELNDENTLQINLKKQKSKEEYQKKIDLENSKKKGLQYYNCHDPIPFFEIKYEKIENEVKDNESCTIFPALCSHIEYEKFKHEYRLTEYLTRLIAIWTTSFFSFKRKCLFTKPILNRILKALFYKVKFGYYDFITCLRQYNLFPKENFKLKRKYVQLKKEAKVEEQPEIILKNNFLEDQSKIHQQELEYRLFVLNRIINGIISRSKQNPDILNMSRFQKLQKESEEEITKIKLELAECL